MKQIFKKNVVKRLSIYSELTVAVHNGVFHADDVFSIALMKELANERIRRHACCFWTSLPMVLNR